MLAVTIGKTTIFFKPIIIIIAFMLCLIIIQAIGIIINMKRIAKDVGKGEYNDIIKRGIPLLRRIKRTHSVLLNKSDNSMSEHLHFALAVSYFSLQQYECFLEHIHTLKHNDNIKYFWIALYHLQQGELEVAQEIYRKIETSDNMQVYRTYYEGLELSKQGEEKLAKEKLNSIYAELKHPVLQKIAEGVL